MNFVHALHRFVGRRDVFANKAAHKYAVGISACFGLPSLHITLARSIGFVHLKMLIAGLTTFSAEFQSGEYITDKNACTMKFNFSYT